jgi:hypothetical protein
VCCLFDGCQALTEAEKRSRGFRSLGPRFRCCCVVWELCEAQLLRTQAGRGWGLVGAVHRARARELPAGVDASCSITAMNACVDSKQHQQRRAQWAA